MGIINAPNNITLIVIAIAITLIVIGIALMLDRYITIGTHSGLEVEVTKTPSSTLDISVNSLTVDLCEDSFHILLELISNFLGLDIPLSYHVPLFLI